MNCEDPRQKHIEDIAKWRRKLEKINEQIGEMGTEIIECDSIGPKHDAEKANRLRAEREKLKNEAQSLTHRIEVAKLAVEKMDEA